MNTIKYLFDVSDLIEVNLTDEGFDLVQIAVGVFMCGVLFLANM